MADGGGAERSSDLAVSRTAIEAAVRVGLILLLAYWCFSIVQPFLVPIVWGLIIAIAVHPGYQRLHHALGGRSVLAATLVTVAALLVLIGPLGMLIRALIEDVSGAAQRLVGGALTLPTPPAWLVGLPVVGPRIEQFWHLATNNLAQALGEVAPQLQAVGVWLLGLVAGAGFGLLNFLVAIVIAGVMLAHAERGQHAADAIAVRLAGNRGPRLVELAERTVRNVARGVIGTALIQSTLVGLGLVVAGYRRPLS
jgi:predicted PurR-regulated permease PerM